MDGLVVLKRDLWSENPKKSSLGLTMKEVLQHYRGVEGTPWPLKIEGFGFQIVDGLAKLVEANKVNTYFVAAKKAMPCDLIHLSTNFQEVSPLGYKLLGFDFGFLPTEDSVYSSIFHEILFGKIGELVEFRYKLNSNLLFDNRQAALEYAKLHSKIESDGRDVETPTQEAPFQIIAVHSNVPSPG